MVKIVGILMVMVLTFTGIKLINSPENNFSDMKSIYEIPLNDIKGKPLDLNKFKGKYMQMYFFIKKVYFLVLFDNFLLKSD